ncbi:auxin-induced protein IAA6-like isoform X1 [Cynara cardunculus var. scolymus]|uniref:auxin-induced protein IAA6-like isoform X1 n=1 Tax=Cynara cardunculus var. scolymus TaxID=59895 RepID=UPI000D62D106|nr:auxin-induced protein IAA6-like isoform X1 [Cynara cardunculus var. scolymus]
MGPQGLGLEITELRLGLPGGGGERSEKKRRVVCGGGGGGKNRDMDVVVVGWPPVCLYRKKSIQVRKMYVKVSMDGEPILRKVDLSCFQGYCDLGMALENLFHCHGIDIGEAMKEESESGEYVAIYEDKDGDWMLVGDVPWLMFTETCKRLGIKKRSDANGIVPCK